MTELIMPVMSSNLLMVLALSASLFINIYFVWTGGTKYKKAGYIKITHGLEDTNQYMLDIKGVPLEELLHEKEVIFEIRNEL